MGTVADCRDTLSIYWDMTRHLFILNGKTDWILLGDKVHYILLMADLDQYGVQCFVFDVCTRGLIFDTKQHPHFDIHTYRFKDHELTFDKLVNKHIHVSYNRLYRLNNIDVNLQFIFENTSMFKLKTLLDHYRLIQSKYNMFDTSELYKQIIQYVGALKNYINIERNEFVFCYVMHRIERIYARQNIFDIIDCEYYNNLDTLKLFFGPQSTKTDVINKQLCNYKSSKMSNIDMVNDLCFDIIERGRDKRQLLYYEIMRHQLTDIVKSKL